MMIYEGDSFFTLAPWGRTGLLLLTIVLTVGTVAALRMIVRKRAPWLRAGAAVLAFWAFIWLSPQAYYTYYRAIIPDLPAQVVIGPAPGPVALGRLMSFTDRATLSKHGKGLLGWALLATGLWPLRKDRTHAP